MFLSLLRCDYRRSETLLSPYINSRACSSPRGIFKNCDIGRARINEWRGGSKPSWGSWLTTARVFSSLSPPFHSSRGMNKWSFYVVVVCGGGKLSGCRMRQTPAEISPPSTIKALLRTLILSLIPQHSLSLARSRPTGGNNSRVESFVRYIAIADPFNVPRFIASVSKCSRCGCVKLKFFL